MSVISWLRAVNSVRSAERLDAQQIKLIREKRFRNLLRHVLQESRFYRKYYQEHGVTAQNVNRVSLEDLPPINKNVMMDHYDDFVCDPALRRDQLEQFISEPSNRGKKYENAYKVIHTSGSSGTVGLFVYGPHDWDMAQALTIRMPNTKPASAFRKSKVAYIGATDGHYAGVSISQGYARLLFKFLPLSINSPLKEISQRINLYQPDFLIGYASGAYLLAQEQIGGNIRIRPKMILCSADPLTPRMRMTIEEAFDVNPADTYVASESMTMGAECDSHRHLHLFDDWFCFEVVDDKLTTVNPGEPGKLLLTNLYNYTQPLIRYQMNDEIVLSDRPCQCGWPFRVLERIAGRQEEFLWFDRPDGTKEYIHPIVIVEFFVPGLEKFQIIQTEMDRLLMKAVVHDHSKNIVAAIHKRMDEILEQKGLDHVVHFDVELVQEILNDPKTGKFKLIVPLTTN
jgi:putative adenylate-forming enzyme